MILTTAYDLPYAVLYGVDPIMSAGQDVRVFASLASVPSAEAVDALDSLLTPFVLLAQSGALAGSSIAPWTSTIADKSDPQIAGNAVQWMLHRCRVDERAMTVLAQMIVSVQQTCQTKRLAFQLAGALAGGERLQMLRGDSTDFPPVYPSLPFKLSQAFELTEEIVVSAMFLQSPSSGLREAVSAEIYAWAAGLLSGAYGLAPVQPDECIAVVEALEWRGNEMTVALTRFLAHPAAIDGLLNVFASIDGSLANISAVIVE